MQKFIGVKLIAAIAMTRLAYNDYRGWQLPADEDGADDGYLVEYLDGGKPNHPDHAGYISWSPTEQFNAAYRPTDGMTFGLALEALKRGERVARSGWNGKGMWLSYVSNGAYDVGCKTIGGDDRTGDYPILLPWIGMKTADEKFVPWLASQTDMLAEDWVIVDQPEFRTSTKDSGC